MDCIVHGVTKSGTRLSNFQFHLEELKIPLRSDIGPEDEHQFSAEKGHTHKHRRERRRQRKQEDTLVIRTVNTGSPYGTSCGQKESWGGMGRSWQAAQAGHSRG